MSVFVFDVEIWQFPLREGQKFLSEVSAEWFCVDFGEVKVTWVTWPVFCLKKISENFRIQKIGCGCYTVSESPRGRNPSFLFEFEVTKFVQKSNIKIFFPKIENIFKIILKFYHFQFYKIFFYVIESCASTWPDHVVNFEICLSQPEISPSEIWDLGSELRSEDRDPCWHGSRISSRLSF